MHTTFNQEKNIHCFSLPNQNLSILIKF
jgi:hypothetical protein